MISPERAALTLTKYFEYYQDTRFVDDNTVIEINKSFFDSSVINKLDYRTALTSESNRTNKLTVGSDENSEDRLVVESSNNQESLQSGGTTDSSVGDAISLEVASSVNWENVTTSVNRGQIVIAL